MKRSSFHRSAGTVGRCALLCSVGLSLLLLVVLTGLARSHLAKPPALARTIVRSEAQSVPERAPGEPSGVVTNQILFQWAQLESGDYRVYVANLRAVHCPERIIQDLIFHDLERLYETKEADLPYPDQFWQPAKVRETASEEREKRRHQMELEKRRLMRELLGVSWSQEAWGFWYDEGFADIAEILVGFLTNEQILEALTAYHDMEAASRAVKNACELCSEEDERARAQAAYQRVANAFAEIMSPAEFEEMALRICVVEQKFEDLSRTEFRFRNGAEVRDFAKVVNGFQPFFSREFYDEDERNEAQTKAEARALFGEERLAVFERSQNGGYQEIWQFGEEQHLPQETRLKAWQVREATEQEFSQLSARTDLPPDELAVAWAGVRKQTETALAALLGASAAKQFLAKHGNWLKASPPNKGGKP